MLDTRDTVSFGATKLNKVTHYGWELSDKQGVFFDIRKTALNVDRDHYQRSLENNDKVLALSRAWSWVACGALIVGRRPDGSLWILDGQHRWAGAMKRSDITHLPCMVYDAAEIKQEAQGFLAANTQRKPVTAIDKFRAQITMEMPAAVLVDDLIKSTGRSVSLTGVPHTIRCVRTLVSQAQTDPERLRNLWSLYCDIHGSEPFDNRLIGGLFYLDQRIPGGLPKRARTRLVEIGHDHLLTALMKAAAYYTKGGAKIWATGILNAFNNRLGAKQRISLPGSEEAE